MAKKRKKKFELDPELRAESEEIQRLLRERLAYHERRREQLRRARGEAEG
jgi:hypothetical protein